MSLDNLAEMPGSRRKTPLRTVQVDDEPWLKFGENADNAGTTRPDVLREIIDWTNADPQLWANVRKIAEQRGETMRGVVLGELRRYVNRHKDLLGEEPSSGGAQR